MKQNTKNIHTFLEERQISWKGLLLWLAAAAVLVAAAVGLQLAGSGMGRTFPVHITEVLASNTVTPNPDGWCCDFIEIHNSADYPVDLTGFQLGDVSGSSRYAFPAGTVMEPGSYLVVYCDKAAGNAAYAPFEISRAGGESFYLIADNKAIVDSVTTIAMDVDQAMILGADDQWILTRLATPGQANAESLEGNRDIYNAAISSVRITEFSAADTGYIHRHGSRCDWVELYNTGSEPADISGFTLSDNAGNNKYTFPLGTILPAGSYLVVNCTDRVVGIDVAPFGLSQEREEMLVLKNAAGLMVEVVHSAPMQGGAMALGADGTWSATELLSPGYENTPLGHETYIRSIGAEAGTIRISEVMSATQTVLPDAYGEFPDWVELYNTGAVTVNLAGWNLSDDPADPEKWILPELILEPGGRAVVFCSGRDTVTGQEIHADFSLSAGGESLTLYSYMGNLVDSVSLPEAAEHSAFVFDDGSCTQTFMPTPGYENSEAGYEAFCATHVPTGPLAIWEVMSANDHVLPQLLGACYDWVELRNTSDEALDLSGFSLADDPADAGVYMLESCILQPGQSVVIILSDEPGVAKPGFQQLLFALDARADRLFLFDPAGKLLDYVLIRDVPAGYSYGRSENSGGFAYMEPTPANPNQAGSRLISAEPVSSYVPGVYSGEAFTVDLQAAGTIYYTTDGSVPTTASEKYQSPVTVTETMVLRAVSIEEGKLVSDVYTATFVVGQEHNLPVVSLVTDPDGLWGYYGVYRNGDISVKETRLAANVAYSGDDGAFTMDCEMNLHGATSVTAFNKKSFRLRFLDNWDGPLNYDVFEDGEVTSFRSLILRTAHESTYSSQMHDVIIHNAALQGSDSVICQKFKYIALYLNGEYWGLYAIREHHSQEHYGTYMDVPADTVKIVRFTSDDYSTSLYQLYQFCSYHSLKDPENYAYAKTILDMESFADWVIFQAYMANMDVYGNMRYYYSPEDGLWRCGLADLDLGIVGSYAAFDSMATTFHHGLLVQSFMTNDEFKDLLATRLAELLAGPLSDENMIASINEIAATIRPETPLEEQRWGTPVSGWENTVDYMINFCDGRAEEMIDSLCWQLNFDSQQREHYFGGLE